MPPASWTTVDTNPTANWTLADAVSNPDFVHSGPWAAWVNYDAAAASDEWLRTSLIDLTGVWDGKVSFWAYSNTNWCPSGGTGATMLFHVTDPTYVATDLLWDMCVDEVWPTTEYRRVEGDLTAFHDQLIRLAWRYVGIDGDSFGLDDMLVTGTPSGPVLFPEGPWPGYAMPVISVR